MENIIFSWASLLLSIVALLISWRAYRRAADAHIVNLSIQLKIPPQVAASPEDLDHVVIIVRNRSLFDVEIEDLILRIASDEFSLMRYEFFGYSLRPPETIRSKHGAEFHVVNSQWGLAVDKDFKLIVKTGSGDEFQPDHAGKRKLVRFIQSDIKGQKELQESVFDK